ncbi:hypothetical protein A7K94_0218190, partial [Modestobacter sp. VKM Ac-2676]
MWSRTASRGPVRRPLARIGVVSLAVVASVGLGVSGAGAAPENPTTTLAPESVQFALWSPQNSGELPVQSPLPGSGFEAIPVAWGGAVTITLPAQVAPTGPTLQASLALVDEANEATRTWSTGAVAPADVLVVTALGGGSHRIDLPADDGVNGPGARLELTGLASTLGAWSSFIEPVRWFLELSAGAPDAVTLASQVDAESTVGCPASDTDFSTCTPLPVTAGTAMDVVLPAATRLDELGIPGLGHSDFALSDVPGGPQIEGLALPLEATPSADARTATMTVPAGTRPGRYVLVSVLGDGAGQVVSATYSVVEVVAPAV